jgi:hypothetical protein
MNPQGSLTCSQKPITRSCPESYESKSWFSDSIFRVKMETAKSSETFVSYRITTRRYYSEEQMHTGGKAIGAWSWPLTSIYCRG